MSIVQTSQRIPNIQFRVLVLGRANAGKTTILQPVCETTESPTIYRQRGKYRRKEKEGVRGPHFVCDSEFDLVGTIGTLERSSPDRIYGNTICMQNSGPLHEFLFHKIVALMQHLVAVYASSIRDATRREASICETVMQGWCV